MYLVTKADNYTTNIQVLAASETQTAAWEKMHAAFTAKLQELNDTAEPDDGPFFIPASRKADMFIPAYSSPDELLDEFKSALAGFGVELPDDFDWFAHVVRIDGTEFYDE